MVCAAYHRLPQSSISLAAFDVGKGEAGRRLNRLDLGIFNLSVLRDEEVRRLGIVVDGTATVEAPKIGLIPKALDDDARALSHRVEKGALRLGAVILPRRRWCVPFEPNTNLRRDQIGRASCREKMCE